MFITNCIPQAKCVTMGWVKYGISGKDNCISSYGRSLAAARINILYGTTKILVFMSHGCRVSGEIGSQGHSSYWMVAWYLFLVAFLKKLIVSVSTGYCFSYIKIIKPAMPYIRAKYTSYLRLDLIVVRQKRVPLKPLLHEKRPNVECWI